MEMASFLNGQNNNGSSNAQQQQQQQQPSPQQQQNHVQPTQQLHQDVAGAVPLSPGASQQLESPPPLLQAALPIEQPL